MALSDKEYIKISLEYNLVVTKLMYDHALLLEILLNIDEPDYSHLYIKELDVYSKMYSLLVDLANGKISQEFIDSESLITNYSYFLEMKTMNIFKNKIDLNLNKKTMQLKAGEVVAYPELMNTIFKLNERIIDTLEKSKVSLLTLDNVIKNKKSVVREEFISHFFIETDLFIYGLEHLQKKTQSTPTSAYKTIFHFCGLMLDHGNFIHDLLILDVNINNILTNFLADYNILINSFDNDINPSSINNLIDRSLYITRRYKQLMIAVLNDSIEKGYIDKTIPIYFDHVIKEVNYTISGLEQFKKLQ